MKCPKCGAENKPERKFCTNCGEMLPGGTTIPEMRDISTTKTSSGLSENTKGALCYLFGWLTGIIFLVIEKENKFVRFHAVQSIMIFGLISILLAIAAVPTSLVFILSFILWIILMYKAYRGEKYKLPIIGDFAEKRVMSQKM